jgi:hypothetical protein
MEYGQKPVDIARQLHWHPSVMQQVVGHDVNPASWNPSSEHDVALWSPATSLRIEAKAPTAMAPPAVTERGGKLLFLRPTQHGRQA